MKYVVFSFAYIAMACLPAAADYTQLQNFPQKAANSYSVVGAALSSGQYLVWNGETVYRQNAVGSDSWDAIATGYLGDPGFIAITPDGAKALLGPGYYTKAYWLDLANPVDYEASCEIAVPTQFGGAFLSNSLLAIDRGKDDWSGTELVVVDASGSKSADAKPRTVLSMPCSKSVVIDKPSGSYSGLVYADLANDKLYVIDANTRELRVFSVAAVIAAFQDSTQLDWNTDGVQIGSAGEYFTNGISGITSSGNLIISGSAGYGLPGGIQIVSNTTGEIIRTLDPVGTQPYYSAIYNPYTDEILAQSDVGSVWTFDADYAPPVPVNAVLAGFAMLAAGVASRMRRS